MIAAAEYLPPFSYFRFLGAILDRPGIFSFCPTPECPPASKAGKFVRLHYALRPFMISEVCFIQAG